MILRVKKCMENWVKLILVLVNKLWILEIYFQQKYLDQNFYVRILFLSCIIIYFFLILFFKMWVLNLVELCMFYFKFWENKENYDVKILLYVIK